ncbi:unnamed protein product, partial [Ixodes hexagonus]
RIRLTIADDLALLREVLLNNPFRDPLQWNSITTQLHGCTGKVFTVRAVRERLDLLLAQYAADDRANLRNIKVSPASPCTSGTEEEYNEREHTLQELLDLAREFGYKVHAPRRGNGAAAAPARERSTPTPTSSRNSATAARDAAAEAYAAAIGGTPDGSEQVTATQLFCQILTGDGEEDVQNPASNSGGSSDNPDQQPAGTARESPQCQSDSTATASPRASRRSEPLRGRCCSVTHYDFLKKRMRHEAAIKEKEFILESRRLALEESRLAWEKERTLNQLRMQEDERRQRLEERTEERRLQRRLSAAQQQSFLNMLESIISK